MKCELCGAEISVNNGRVIVERDADGRETSHRALLCAGCAADEGAVTQLSSGE